MSKLIQHMGEEWYELLKPIIETDYFKRVGAFVNTNKFNSRTVYPTGGDIFKPFKLTQPSDVKVVILGNGPDKKDNNLAWSGKDLLNMPSGLNTILKEVENSEHDGFKLDQDPDLTRWAEQGVLLLNTCLTMEKGKPPLDHYKVWAKFNKYVIKALSDKFPAIIFIFWGDIPKKLISSVNKDASFVLTAPSPLDVGGFLDNGCFKKSNEVLKEVAISKDLDPTEYQIQW